MRSLILSLLVVTFTGACAALPPPSKYPEVDPSVDGEQTGFDVASALYDEATGLAAVEYRSEDGVLSGRVLAADAPTVAKADSGYAVDIPVGGDAASIRCQVQEGVLGLSAFARALAKTYLFSYPAYELKYVFAGARQGQPFLAVHGQYIDRGAGGLERRTGFIKIAVSGRSEVAVACLHDQFGYRETLERVATSLARDVSWSRPKPLLPLVGRAVYVAEKAGTPAGVRETVTRADEEDFRSSWVRTAYLSLGGSKILESKDVLETFESDPDGRVIAATYQSRDNGELRMDLKVSEGPMPAYEVTGTIGGEAAKARFTVDGGLADPQLLARWRAEQRAFTHYWPEVDAAAAVGVEVTATESGLIRVVSPKRTLEGRIDDAGRWIRLDRPDGWRFVRETLEP